MKSKICLFICSMLVVSVALASVKAVNPQTGSWNMPPNTGNSTPIYTANFRGRHDRITLDVYNDGPDKINVSGSGGWYSICTDINPNSFCEVHLWPSSNGDTFSVYGNNFSLDSSF